MPLSIANGKYTQRAARKEKLQLMHTQFGHYWRLLVTYLKPQWRSVVLLSILLMSNIALQLINPQVIRYFIDATQACRPLSALLHAPAPFLPIPFLPPTSPSPSPYPPDT